MRECMLLEMNIGNIIKSGSEGFIILYLLEVLNSFNPSEESSCFIYFLAIVKVKVENILDICNVSFQICQFQAGMLIFTIF